jgi:hypothetical protein
MQNKTRILVRLLRDVNGNRTRYSAKAIIDTAGVMTYVTKRTPADISRSVTRGYDLAAAELAAQQGLVGEWRAHLDPVKGVQYYCLADSCNCPAVAGRRSTLVCFEVLCTNAYTMGAGH